MCFHIVFVVFAVFLFAFVMETYCGRCHGISHAFIEFQCLPEFCCCLYVEINFILFVFLVVLLKMHFGCI